MLKNQEQDRISEEFLIAEFNALQQRASDYEQLKNNRVNFFLIVVAASIAILPTMIEKFQAYEWIAAAFVSLAILLIGLVTLNQVVVYSISIVAFYQRAGRIRRWFVEQNKRISSFVAFAPRDDRPLVKLSTAFLALRGGDTILIAINSMALAAISVVVLQSSIAYVNQVVIVVFGTATVIVFWLLQYQWVKHKLQTASKQLEREIHFPYTEEMRELYSQKEIPKKQNAPTETVSLK